MANELAAVFISTRITYFEFIKIKLDSYSIFIIYVKLTAIIEFFI